MVAEIIKNMPIPPMKRRGAGAKYPWGVMQPGDAFQFDADVSFASARSMASQHQAGHMAKAKFVVRDTAAGLFCWRVDGTAHALVNGNAAQTAPMIKGYAPTDKAREAAFVADGLSQTIEEDDVI